MTDKYINADILEKILKSKVENHKDLAEYSTTEIDKLQLLAEVRGYEEAIKCIKIMLATNTVNVRHAHKFTKTWRHNSNNIKVKCDKYNYEIMEGRCNGTCLYHIDYDEIRYYCSECENYLGEHGEYANFCQHCGARVYNGENDKELRHTTIEQSLINSCKEVSEARSGLVDKRDWDSFINARRNGEE